MSSDPTTAELVGLVIVLGGLLFTFWALATDMSDLMNVRYYGEVGGPRWITARGHLLANLKFLGAWVCALVWVGVAVYLPSRTDEPTATLAQLVGWCRVLMAFCVLLAQIDQRATRFSLSRLPLESWERMVAAMSAGMAPAERVALVRRLGLATDAGRQMGHLVANELQAPVASLSLLSDDEVLAPEHRAIVDDVIADLVGVAARARALHGEIKALVPEEER